MKGLLFLALSSTIAVTATGPFHAREDRNAQAAQGAQPTRIKVDVSTLGPQVGERVPDFGLPDQNGKVWTRQSIMGPKGAMLVFVRSADW